MNLTHNTYNIYLLLKIFIKNTIRFQKYWRIFRLRIMIKCNKISIKIFVLKYV